MCEVMIHVTNVTAADVPPASGSDIIDRQSHYSGISGERGALMPPSLMAAIVDDLRMNDKLQQKVCPICAQSIGAAAKKCPFFHRWQTRWHTTVFHPIFSAAVVGGPLLLL